jgi:DNA repair exonuclease SbcCD ATPase subunit
MPTEETGTEGQEPEAPEPSTDPWADPEKARAEIDKLRKEAAGWRTKVRELEPQARKAQEADEATKSEIQKALDRLAEAEQRAQAATFEAARLRAASAHGLTEAQAKRLVGSTPEELDADAKAYAAEVGTNGARKADLKQGTRGVAAPPDPDAWLRRLAKQQ